MKKKIVLALGIASLVSLAACGETQTSSSSTSGGSGDSSSSSSSAATGRRVEMTLENNVIPAGTNFFDGCQPTVIYYDANENATDYTDWKNYTRYTITNDAGVEFSAGDALPAGRYTAQVVCQSRRTTVDFTVESGTVVEGAEGSGYKTIYAEDFDGMEISKHPNVGTLGAGKFPGKSENGRNPKMIVVPVTFSNIVSNPQYDFSEEEIDVIEKAFFGEADETSWQSLRSFYYSSSYGNLTIDGIVTDKFVVSMTTDEAERQGSGAAATIATQAANWYFQNHPEEKRTDYDFDGDGYLDGINLIYKTNKANTNEDENASDLWWNYTSTTGASANASNPPAYRYFWSLYEFITTPYYNDDPVIDAHTIIHENGHLIGLNDYYSYDRTEQGGATEGVAGCVDMMDNNVGDHNAYSKMLLNQLRKEDGSNDGLNVMYVDGSNPNFTLELNSFTDTGDVVVIRNTTTDAWNETPYDEYLILQYYTPTGVNEGDSNGYREWQELQSHGGTYADPGLQVFHIDARLGAQIGTYDLETGNLLSYEWQYTDELNDAAQRLEDGTYIGASTFLTDNTGSRSRNIVDGTIQSNSAFREISAILSSGVNGLSGSTYYNLFGETSNLFGTDTYAEEINATYGGNTYSNFQARDFYSNDLVWNDGSEFNWTFSVESQDADSCVIHFVDNSAI